MLRHGEAVERVGRYANHDDARPLTPKGRRRVRRVAGRLRQWDVSFDIILSSPLVRARQTAEIVAEVLKAREQIAFARHLLPGSDGPAFLEELNVIAKREHHLESILVVGHEPCLSRLTSLLLTGECDLPVDFKKAGLCKLSLTAIRPGPGATLEWMVVPKLLGA